MSHTARTRSAHGPRLQSTLHALNDGLQGASRVAGRSFSYTARDLEDRANRVRDEVTRIGAACMLRAPWRIARAVYPHLASAWPVKNRSLAAVLDDCRRSMELERERASHWTHDFNRLVALHQAERALQIMLSGDRQAPHKT